MVSQLLEHERIETTLPKAKELRRVADNMVTLAKEVRVALAPCGPSTLLALPLGQHAVGCNVLCGAVGDAVRATKSGRRGARRRGAAQAVHGNS